MASQITLDTNPYLPPRGVAVPEADRARAGKRAGKLAFLMLGLSILAIVAAAALSSAIRSDAPAIAGLVVSSILAIGGCGLGLRSVVLRLVARASPGFTVAVIGAVLANGLMAFLGVFWAFFDTVSGSRGRQLRHRFGRVLLPEVRASGERWARLPLEAGVDGALRAAVAAQWRENGRTEHASVAAFARLSLDLMALGAPPALLASANRDALDEIRHAELCFSLARAIDGEAEGPAPFPEAARAHTLPASRPLALAALAVDSLVDGALNEGVSARVIAKLARRCEEPAIRAVLRELAADEGRHAAHGWEVVAWCLAEGGGAVAAALRGAIAALPRTMTSKLPEGARAGGWERLGIHGEALEAEQLSATREDLVRRVERMIGDERAAA
jgi:hypothetical protein